MVEQFLDRYRSLPDRRDTYYFTRLPRRLLRSSKYNAALPRLLRDICVHLALTINTGRTLPCQHGRPGR
jgi:hypothetical protein